MSKKNRKQTYAFFQGERGARIYVNPQNLEELNKRGKVVKVTPEIQKKFKGKSPSEWRLKGESIRLAKESNEFEEVQVSVQPHALPEVNPVEIKQEFLVIEPNYGKTGIKCAIIGVLATLITELIIWSINVQ